MKHTFSFLLLLCMLLLTLAGCGAGNADAAKNASGTEGTRLVCNKDGILFLDEFVIRNGLSFYSYQNGERKTLCPDPLCTHEGGTGCFMYGKRFVRGVLEDNILYFSAWDISASLEEGCILGSYDLQKMKLELFISYDRSTMLEEFVKCGDALYYYIINADGGYDIRRYDIRTKKDMLLYQYDQYIKSIKVGEGYLAFDTWEGLYLLALDSGSARLVLPMNADMQHDYFYFLHNGYLYYPTNRYIPDCWRETDIHREDELLPGDYYRFPLDGDISQSECVIKNTYGSLVFKDQKIYYLPAELHISVRYYYHDKNTGSDDLPKHLFSITGNQGGVAVYDEATGESSSVARFENLDISNIDYVDEERLIVTGLGMDNMTFGEDRFVDGGYRTFNQNFGYYLINLKDNTYQMLVQPIPTKDAY